MAKKKVVTTSNTSQKSGHNYNKLIKCPQCIKNFRSDTLNRHLKTHNNVVKCNKCKQPIRTDKMTRHKILCDANIDVSKCNRSSETADLDIDNASCKSVNGHFKSFDLDVRVKKQDYDNVLKSVMSAAQPKIIQLRKKNPLKVQVVVHLEFVKQHADPFEGILKQYSDKRFRSACEPILEGDDLSSFLGRATAIIRHDIETYTKMGSGWMYYRFKNASLDVARYRPLSGGGKWTIPKKLKNKRSILCINTPNNKCFLYSVVAGILNKRNSLPTKHRDRYTNYTKHLSLVDDSKLTYPVRIKDIAKFETENKLSISIFEWDKEDDSVIPIKQGIGNEQNIDLLFIDDCSDSGGHYLLIKDFNAFMRHRTKHHNSMHYCRKCLHGFVDKDKQLQHTELCKQGINQIIKMPESGTIKFKNNFKQDKKLFAVYFDFECLNIKHDYCATDPKKSSVTKLSTHVPCSYCIMTKSEIKDYNEETIIYYNDDPDEVSRQFIEDMDDVHKRMMECYKQNQHPINMSTEDENNFLSAKNCHICKKKLDWSSLTNYPVKDHDHMKKYNNFRGAAHNYCNLNYYNRTKKVPAFAHNLKGYDMNLFIRDLVRRASKIVSIIPENIEKFKAVYTENFIYLDSYAFLSTSLENLVSNLKKDGLDNFKRLNKEFPEYADILVEKVSLYASFQRTP